MIELPEFRFFNGAFFSGIPQGEVTLRADYTPTVQIVVSIDLIHCLQNSLLF